MKTPTNRKSQGGGVDQEKSSGKKLRQARLPFKILSTPLSETCEGVADAKISNEHSEARKRKLSYNEKEDTEANAAKQSSKKRTLKNAALPVAAKKRKDTFNDSAVKKTKSIVIELSDSNDSDDNAVLNDSGCKENLTRVTKQKSSAKQENDANDMHSDDAELITTSDEEQTKASEIPKIETPSITPATNKNKKGETVRTTPVSNKNPPEKPSKTPQSGSKTTRKSVGDATSSCKLQIKLPIGGKKNKRRKQVQKTAEVFEEQDMSDDIEVISAELHPTKKQKLDTAVDDKSITNEAKDLDGSDEKVNEVHEEKMFKENSKKENIKTKKVELVQKELSKENEDKGKAATSKMSDSSNTKPADESVSINSADKRPDSEDLVSENELSKSKIHHVSSTTSDLEVDTEAETTVNSERPQTTGKTESSKITGDSSAHKLQKKNLTPKQQKLHEQRLKAREEKERKIQEERLQKQREKEEREQAKKREREEKEEQRRKEREEKEDQRRKEREEKERKRLAEIEAKNEEKRKRNEAKEEEQRKKEEERKRKEQEKEEAEIKKKKAAMAFTKFFSRPMQDAAGQRTGEDNSATENHELLAFRPFQIKGDMKLAPIVRKKLTHEERARLIGFLEAKDFQNDEKKSAKLYINELKSGSIKPYKWSPPAQNGAESVESKQEKDDDDEVVIIEDELERAGQAIVEEHNEPIERFRAKFYKFRENRRPPYFGTWRKRSTVITARRPFAQDKKFFDYEVDSDDEWEEEEPGESLDGSDDDKEKESEDEDYEVDNEWFVPHGHLSEEEMQNEDDLGESNDREAQKAKLQILQQEFAQEMKKKTEKIKPRLIGCIWVDENGNQPELCPKIIWDTLNMRAILCAEPPVMEEIKTSEKNGEISVTNGHNGDKVNGETKLKPITMTEIMLKDLIKLVHGNTHSKNFLIKEFIAYIEANEESVRNGDVRGPLKSTVREKIDEFAKWQITEPTLNNSESKNTKAQKNKKKLCWVVSEESLKKMELEKLDLNNEWEYILQPRSRSRKTQNVETAPTTIANGDDSNEQSETSTEQCNRTSGNTTDPQTPQHIKSNRNSDIKKFTKVLTAEEKAQQLQKQAEQTKTPSTRETSSPITIKQTPKNVTQKTSNANQTPTTKKRVPLLISVARGQSIPTPDKNARISQFLKTINEAKQKEKPKNSASATPMETDEIVVLD